MIYVKLFINLLFVGAFSFGGAYSAIPLIEDVARDFGIFTEDMITNFIAISESTPGPIGVNLATFIGSYVAGPVGAVVATIAEVLPAFIIILVYVKYFKDYLNNKNFAYYLSIIRPAIIGMIMATGIGMLVNVINFKDLIISNNTSDIKKSIITFIILVLIVFIYKLFRKKSLNAIFIIVISAIIGIIINRIIL